MVKEIERFSKLRLSYTFFFVCQNSLMTRTGNQYEY